MEHIPLDGTTVLLCSARGLRAARIFAVDAHSGSGEEKRASEDTAALHGRENDSVDILWVK